MSESNTGRPPGLSSSLDEERKEQGNMLTNTKEALDAHMSKDLRVRKLADKAHNALKRAYDTLKQAWT